VIRGALIEEAELEAVGEIWVEWPIRFIDHIYTEIARALALSHHLSAEVTEDKIPIVNHSADITACDHG